MKVKISQETKLKKTLTTVNFKKKKGAQVFLSCLTVIFFYL